MFTESRLPLSLSLSIGVSTVCCLELARTRISFLLAIYPKMVPTDIKCMHFSNASRFANHFILVTAIIFNFSLLSTLWTPLLNVELFQIIATFPVNSRPDTLDSDSHKQQNSACLTSSLPGSRGNICHVLIGSPPCPFALGV